MTGEPCSLELDVSEHLFKLTTESVRLRSNQTKSHGTLADLVTDRVDSPKKLDDQSPETIREHLSAIPTNGDIRINLLITKSSADGLAELKRRMAEKLGSSLSLGDAISIILFNYIAEQKAADIMQRLGLDEMEQSQAEAPADANSGGDNVIPLRKPPI